MALSRNEILFMVQKGILAPSADNTQPWQFRIRKDTIDLFIPRRTNPHFLDVGFKSLYISAGAVIENMRVAAAEIGYRLIPQYVPDANLGVAASIRFEKETERLSHADFPMLERRVTNRKFYRGGKTLSPEIYRLLEQKALEEKGFRILWINRHDPRYSALCRMVGLADQLRYESQRLHEELFETVRFSEEEADRTRDGLYIKTFEAGPFGDFLFKLMSEWRRLKLLNRFGVSRLFNQYAQRQLLSSDAAGLIVADHHKLADYVKGGEVMERVWHEMTRFQLAMQPMSALPIFIIDSILNESRSFDANQQRILNQLKADFFSLFGITEENGLILLFRCGTANPPSARSCRRPVESFILEESAIETPSESSLPGAV